MALKTDVAKGSPVEASVTATVIAHRRGRKIRVFTYKPKKRHRRTLGYRSQLTELRIDEVGRGKAAAKPKAAAPKRAERRAKAVADEGAAIPSQPLRAEAAEAMQSRLRRRTEVAVPSSPSKTRLRRRPPTKRSKPRRRRARTGRSEARKDTKPKKDPDDGA